jgi:CheY-like chemotaxis protein
VAGDAPAQHTQTVDGPDASLQPGDYVHVRITDTGIGMDEMTLAKATEPFFTTKGPGKGTGLGLSMVHGLAAQSGGQLRIHSEPNVGTTIELWLPMAEAAPLPVENDVPSLIPAPYVGPCKVLIVDDDLLVMTGISAMIEDLVHTSIEAHSGAETLTALA